MLLGLMTLPSGAVAQSVPISCSPLGFQIEQNLVLACNSTGLFRTKGENNWQMIYPASPRTEADLSPNGTIYLYDAYTTHELRRSVDGGAHWEVMGILPFSNFAGNDHIFTTPVSGTLFLGIWDYPFSTSYERGIFKSTNGGLTWVRVLSGGNGVYVSASPDFATDGTAFAAMDEYHTSLGIWKTTNGGDQWAPVNTGLYTGGCLTGHAWVTVSPQFSQDQTVFTSDCTGLYKTVDGGQSWSKISNLVLYDAPVLSPSYLRDQIMILGSLEYGLLLSYDGGLSYTRIRGGGVYAAGLRYQLPFEQAVVTTTPPISAAYQVYVPAVYGTPELEFWVTAARGGPYDFNCYLYRSRDYGQTWQEVPVLAATNWTYLPVTTQ